MTPTPEKKCCLFTSLLPFSLTFLPFQSLQAPTFPSSMAEFSSPTLLPWPTFLLFKAFSQLRTEFFWNQVRWLSLCFLMLFYLFCYSEKWSFFILYIFIGMWCWKVSGWWRWDFCALSLIGSVDRSWVLLLACCLSCYMPSFFFLGVMTFTLMKSWNLCLCRSLL